MIKEREIFEKIEPYFYVGEAIVVTGMRRTGKTTLLQCIYNNIKSGNKIMLDIENPLNRRYFEQSDYERVKSSFEVLGINFAEKAYIFLDEIQFVKNLPSIVKYFIDHYGVKFFLTGSASFYLKNLFAESLAGRKYIFELFPLNFREFLLFKNSKLNLPDNANCINEAVFDTFATLYEEYLLFGGFPGVVLKTDVEAKKKALEDIFSSFFQLEVMQLGDYKRNDVIRDLMLLLIERIGFKLDIQKLSKELGVSRPTISEYISFLEGTYFIKLVRPYSKHKNTELRKIPKVYTCDSGFANQFVNLSEGALFENNVFQSLRMKGELNYYQKKSGAEIDFILDKKRAFEVKLTPSQSDLRKLKKMSNELDLKELRIVSRNYSEIENIEYGFTI